MYFDALYTCVHYYANCRQTYGLYGGEVNYQDAVHNRDILLSLAEVLGKDVKTLIDFYRIAKKLNIGFRVSDNKKLERIYCGLEGCGYQSYNNQWLLSNGARVTRVYE